MTDFYQRIDELKRLLARATRGPWIVCEDEDEVVVVVDDEDNNWPHSYSLVAGDFNQGIDDGLSDAQLIVQMRDLVPELIAAAEERNELAASVTGMVSALRALCEHFMLGAKQEAEECQGDEEQIAYNAGIEQMALEILKVLSKGIQ